MALVSHFGSGKYPHSVKGINLITLYYTDPVGHPLPVNDRIDDHTEAKTKNNYFLERLDEVMAWGLTPGCVTSDSWHSATKNFKAIRNNDLGFMVALKSHRQVSLEKNLFLSVKDVDIPSEGLVVWLRELGFVRLYRTTLKNEHRHYALYLPDAAQLGEVTRTEFEAIHDPHWQIEPYHRAIKPVCPIEHSQVRGEAGVKNHVFAALPGYIHLQTMCLAELITNTDALQRNLFGSYWIPRSSHC